MGNILLWIWTIIFAPIFGGLGAAAGGAWTGVKWTAYTGLFGLLVGSATILYWFLGVEVGPISMLDYHIETLYSIAWWISIVVTAFALFAWVFRMYPDAEQKAFARSVLLILWFFIVIPLWMVKTYPYMHSESAHSILRIGAAVSLAVLLVFYFAGNTLTALLRPIDDPNVRGDVIGDVEKGMNAATFWILALQFILIELEPVLERSRALGRGIEALPILLAIAIIIVRSKKSAWPARIIISWGWVFLFFNLFLPAISDSYAKDGLKGLQKYKCEVSRDAKHEALLSKKSIKPEVDQMEKDAFHCKHSKPVSPAWETAKLKVANDPDLAKYCSSVKAVRMTEIEDLHDEFIFLEVEKERCLARIPADDSLVHAFILWIWPVGSVEDPEEKDPDNDPSTQPTTIYVPIYVEVPPKKPAKPGKPSGKQTPTEPSNTEIDLSISINNPIQHSSNLDPEKSRIAREEAIKAEIEGKKALEEAKKALLKP